MSDFKAKCTKFNFGWAYSAPPDPLAEFKGLTFKSREEKGGSGWKGPLCFFSADLCPWSLGVQRRGTFAPSSAVSVLSVSDIASGITAQHVEDVNPLKGRSVNWLHFAIQV